MERIKVIILKDCKGSETGITVKKFLASEIAQDVEVNLAGVFIKSKLAVLPEKEAPMKAVKEEKKEEKKLDNKMAFPKENK